MKSLEKEIRRIEKEMKKNKKNINSGTPEDIGGEGKVRQLPEDL